MLAAIILYISSVSLHLEKNRPVGFFFLTIIFYVHLKKKKRKECLKIKRMVHSKLKYAVVYLCLIPMQYGVKSDSRH